MKSIIFNLLLAFSITTVSAEPISTSPLVDLLNMLQKNFTNSNDDGTDDFGIESKKKDKKVDKFQKKEKPKQISRTGWVKTPEGLKFYIRAGNNEIKENVRSNKSELVAKDEQNTFIENEDVRNYEQNNNKENNREDKEDKNEKINEESNEESFGTGNQSRMLAGENCREIPYSVEERNEPVLECGEECGFGELLCGHGPSCAQVEEMKCDKSLWRKPHRHRWECNFCYENFEEAMYVEMCKQTRILRHIERMLMGQRATHFNHKRNKGGRFCGKKAV